MTFCISPSMLLFLSPMLFFSQGSYLLTRAGLMVFHQGTLGSTSANPVLLSTSGLAMCEGGTELCYTPL